MLIFLRKYSRRCVISVAASLALGPANAATDTGGVRAMSGQQRTFLNLYTPETNVDDFAALDIHLKNVQSRLAKGTGSGLAEAKDVYTNGMPSVGDGTQTLKQLSTTMGKFGWTSPTFGHVVDWNGEPNYGDQFVDAAFEGKDYSNFKAEDYPGKGNFHLSKFGLEGRAAAINYGVPLLHVWMHVLAQIEKGAINCRTTGGINAEQIVMWDKAVAIYTGSESISGSGADDRGHFLYSLTQAECLNFGTCKKGEIAPMNTKIFDAFRSGKDGLVGGNCNEVKKEAHNIKRDMTVLLVQGVLRSAYALDVQQDSKESTQGMAAAFTAAILPLLNFCYPSDAFIVHNNMEPGKGTEANWDAVQQALEHSYYCLGIDCEDVGGLVNANGSGYLAGAEACNAAFAGSSGSNYEEYNTEEYKEALKDAHPPKEESAGKVSNIALIVGLTFGVVGGFVAGLAVASLYIKKKKTTSEEVELMEPEYRDRPSATGREIL